MARNLLKARALMWIVSLALVLQGPVIPKPPQEPVDVTSFP